MNINTPRSGGGFVLPFMSVPVRTSSHSIKSNRVPFLGWVPDNVFLKSKF